MKKRIAVLLTVHNRKDRTLNCLRNLYNNSIPSYIEFDVFLTDDGSVDGTSQAITKEFSEVKILTGDGELYWNRGMYKAWEEARGDSYDYFFWLNDDTILKKDAVTALIKGSERHSDAIIIGTTSDFNNDHKYTYGGRSFRRNYPLIEPSEHDDVLCDTFNGNIVLVPQSVYKRIGILDPFFRHSFGDIEYGLRALKNGIESYIVPGVLGYCKRDRDIPIFRRKGVPIFKRYKLLYSPLGYNPIEEFYLNRKYYPLTYSVWWFIKIHLNVLFTK